MKKGYELLGQLSTEEQVLFCKNITNLKKVKLSKYLLEDWRNLDNFVCNAFNWSHSPEGHDYWNRISNR